MLRRPFIPHVPVTRALAIPALRLAHTSALRHAPLATSAHSPAPSRPSLQTREVLLSRSFSTTPRRYAEEDPNLQAMFAQQQKLLKLLQDKPEVLDNIKEFVTLLQNNGVDVHSGQMPSKMDMFRLLMKTEIRESAMKMASAFQEAGIDLQSKDMMQSLMAMQKQFKDNK
ncbi:hypothetical protein K466DRAFT_600776 [Polyporus arcularius HHB13444]|uniref:Uncharacterized protein n=1 Tax=Polyporus arcularius HHB13444 TaxID=1314778 RepID=A0A5C3P8A1_9APHY|nr:hypothetical protein K466DRAFT_600776 [Polyporus arcularius HHB13444]